MRTRAGVVILDGSKVLLMHRYKGGREYYIVPGGGVEPGETVREAAIREAWEETSLVVELGRELFTHETDVQREHYFEVTKYCGEPGLGDEELQKSSWSNRYSLEWIDKEKLEDLNLLPPGIRAILL